MKNYATILMMIFLGLIVTASAGAAFAAPVNDNFANATAIILENGTGNAVTENTAATKEAGEPLHAENAGGASLWFKFTPTVTSAYRIATTFNTFNTLLAVYTGSSVNNLQPAGFNDDCTSACGGASTVELMLVAGTTYYIAVDSFNDGSGTDEGAFKVTISDNGVTAIDNLSGAYQLGTSSGGSIGGTTFGATKEAGELNHYLFLLPDVKSVWYKWRPSGNFPAHVQLTENFNSVMAVYSVNPAISNPTFNQMTKVTGTAANDTFGYAGLRYQSEFFADQNLVYYIVVSGYSQNGGNPEGNFQLKYGKNHLRYSTDFETHNDKTAISIFRPSSGIWYSLADSQSSTLDGVQWGASGDTPVAADYDGDGETDIAVARNVGGVKNWYIYGATGISGLSWGAATDKPVVGDFDGDGKADVGAMRLTANGYAWYIRQSTNGAMKSFLFGTTGDKPVFGDFDGDGMTEVAVVRNGQNGLTWYMLKSSTDYSLFAAQNFGIPTDITVAEDYDADGKTDVAVFRPSTGYWYILRSSDGTLDYKPFGQQGDRPQPADYDGDGKADICVVRPADNNWYILQSGNASVTSKQWGAAGDIAVSSMTTLSY